MGKRNFFKQIELAESYMLEHKKEREYLFLQKLNDFITKGTFCNGKRQKQFLNLRMLSENEIASLMGCSASSVRRLRMETSDKLYKLFGTNFFDILYTFNGIENCEGVFRVITGEVSLEDIVNFSIWMLIRGKEFNDNEYPISECIMELKFLAKHSNATLYREMEELDLNKLNYLVKLTKSEANLPKKVELAKLWNALLSM